MSNIGKLASTLGKDAGSLGKWMLKNKHTAAIAALPIGTAAIMGAMGHGEQAEEGEESPEEEQMEHESGEEMPEEESSLEKYKRKRKTEG